MAARDRTLSIAFVWPFQRAYARLGVPDEEQIGALLAYGLSAEALARPDARLPLEQAIEHVERFQRELRRPDLALLAARAVIPGDFGEIEQAARACRTAGEALQVLAAGFGLFADGVHLAIEPRPDAVALRFFTDPDLRLPPFAAEFFMLTLRRMGPYYFGADLEVRGVAFAHPPVAHADAVRAAFACPVTFDAVETALYVDPAVLTAEGTTASPSAAELLRARIAGLAAEAGGDDLIARVERAIGSELEGGLPTLADVARVVGSSERTLHRRFKQAGTSYRALCEQVRLRMARHYLEQTRLPIKEIAAKLGYHDVHPFHRTFKRLTGSTPKQHREQHRG